MPEWAKEQGFADNPAPSPGAKLFAQAAAGTATPTSARARSNLGAPDLSDDRRERARTPSTSPSYVANPAAVRQHVMPPFGGLGEENLAQVGAFLAASKGAE